jgi:hypothetical protein
LGAFSPEDSLRFVFGHYRVMKKYSTINHLKLIDASGFHVMDSWNVIPEELQNKNPSDEKWDDPPEEIWHRNFPGQSKN